MQRSALTVCFKTPSSSRLVCSAERAAIIMGHVALPITRGAIGNYQEFPPYGEYRSPPPLPPPPLPPPPMPPPFAGGLPSPGSVIVTLDAWYLPFRSFFSTSNVNLVPATMSSSLPL